MPSQRRAGAVLGYANIIVKNLVNLVYTPMLLSFVGQADYGVYQTSSSFVFSLTLLSFGFSQAYVRFYARCAGDEGAVRSLNGMYLVLYGVASAVALAAGLVLASASSLFFAGSFTAAEVELARAVMSVMAGSVAVTLFGSVFDAYVLAREEFRFQQSRQLAASLAAPLASWGLLLLGAGVVGVAVAQLVVNVALLALNVFFCLGRLGMRFNVRHFDATLFRAIAAFSAWVFANQVCDLVNQNVPNVLLGAFSGASAVAVFAVAVQVRSIFVSLSVVMSNVFVPEVNRIAARSENNAELGRLMARVGRWQMVLFCWVYGGFALLGRFFVERWAGPGFADAYWLVLAMGLPLAVPLCQNVGIEIQRAKNMHRARSAALLFMAVFNVAFTVLAAPSLGYWAAAIGYIASIALGNGLFMNWYYSKKVGLDMSFFWRTVLPVVFAAVAATVPCLAASVLLPIRGWGSFLAWGAVYTVLFAVAMWFTVLNDDEKARVAKLLHLKG